MADPVTMTMIAAAGTLMEGVSAYSQAKSEQAVAKQNANIAQQQYMADEQRQRRQSRWDLGEQFAAMSESGTGLSGSNFDLMNMSATNAELDALNIRYSGIMDTENYKYQARAAGSRATGALIGTAIGVAGKLSSIQKPTANKNPGTVALTRPTYAVPDYRGYTPAGTIRPIGVRSGMY